VNYIYRIMVAIYAFISAIICGFIMISPFGEKIQMSTLLEYLQVNFYQSNKYNLIIFLLGLIFFCLSIVILFSGLKGAKSGKYICVKNDTGMVKISSTSIENIALALSKRFQGVTDAKAKAGFKGDSVVVSVKLTINPDVHVPTLCKNVQDRIKSSVETSMDLSVKYVDVSVDNVHSNQSLE